jgi:hypothetical protein
MELEHPPRCAKVKRTSRSARQLTKRSIPIHLLDKLRQHLQRLEPALSRLVKLYDELAVLRTPQRPANCCSVVDESLSVDLGIPSEVDIRAAAVRLFAAEHSIPAWLRRSVNPSRVTLIAEDEDPVSADSHDIADLEDSGVDSAPWAPGLIHPQLREDLLEQYAHAAAICQELVQLCDKLESSFPVPMDPASRQAMNDSLRVQTGIGLDDVSAAASRLRVKTPA